MANIYLDCSEGLKKPQLTAFERLLRQVKSFTSAMLMDAGISVITWHFHVRSAFLSGVVHQHT